MSTIETSSGSLAPGKANVRITLTGAQYAALAGILVSSKAGEALAEGAQKAEQRGGVAFAIGFLTAGLDAREKILGGLKKVKQAVVVDNMQEGTIDV